MKKYLPLLIISLLIFSGCTQVEEKEAKPTVVVSFYVLEALSELIGQDQIEIINILPYYADPHSFELGSDQMITLSKNPNLILIGNDFEHWYSEAYPDVKPENANVLDTSIGIETLESEAGIVDPHIWNSLDNLESISQSIAAYLKEIVSDDARIDQNLETLLARIEAIRTKTDPLFENKKRTMFVVERPAFNYLAHAYGLEMVSVAEFGHASEIDAKQLQNVIKIIQDNSIPIVFYDNPLNKDVADTLTLETGVQTRLLSSLESIDKNSGKDIIDLIEDNIKVLAEALQ